jgi:signal peptidase II
LISDRRATGGRHRARRVSVVAMMTAAVVALDQTTKTLALDRLRGGPIHLAGPLSLALSFNSGVAFSLGTGLTVPIIVIGAVLVVVLLWFARGSPSYPVALGTGLVLGGALGNLADRIFRSHGGAVIDFIHFGFWPTFNVADVAIVVGAVVLVLAFWRRMGGSRADGSHAPGVHP